MEMAPPSSYAQQRLENIRRNQERMQQVQVAAAELNACGAQPKVHHVLLSFQLELFN